MSLTTYTAQKQSCLKKDKLYQNKNNYEISRSKVLLSPQISIYCLFIKWEILAYVLTAAKQGIYSCCYRKKNSNSKVPQGVSSQTSCANHSQL